MAAKPKKDKPNKPEKQALHTALNSKFGIALGQIRALINEDNNTLTREDIEQALRLYFRARPKA
jgi:hypothetical protein